MDSHLLADDGVADHHAPCAYCQRPLGADTPSVSADHALCSSVCAQMLGVVHAFHCAAVGEPVGAPVLTATGVKTLRPFSQLGGDLQTVAKSAYALANADSGGRNRLGPLRVQIFGANRVRRHDRTLQVTYASSTQPVVPGQTEGDLFRSYDLRQAQKQLYLNDFFDEKQRPRVVQFSGVPAAEPNDRTRFTAAFRLERGLPGAARFPDPPLSSVYWARDLDLGARGRRTLALLQFAPAPEANPPLALIILVSVGRAAKPPRRTLLQRLRGRGKPKAIYAGVGEFAWEREESDDDDDGDAAGAWAVERPPIAHGVDAGDEEGGADGEMPPIAYGDAAEAAVAADVDARFLAPGTRPAAAAPLEALGDGEVPSDSPLVTTAAGIRMERAARRVWAQLVLQDARESRADVTQGMTTPRERDRWAATAKIELHGDGALRPRVRTVRVPLVAGEWRVADMGVRAPPAPDTARAEITRPTGGRRRLLLVSGAETGTPFFLSDLYAPTLNDAQARSRSLTFELALRLQANLGRKTAVVQKSSVARVIARINAPYAAVAGPRERAGDRVLVVALPVRLEDDAELARKSRVERTHVRALFLVFARRAMPAGAPQWELDRIVDYVRAFAS